MLREGSPPLTCHVSGVICHMSRVTCHFLFGQRCEASQWRVCYQWGLPRLVFTFIMLK